jgi:hypothetical protein
MNTSGFYKKEYENLLYGPNYVMGGSYNLYKEQKNTYTYPIGDWYWFDSEEEARLFFNLPKPPEEKFPLFGNNLPK